MYKGTYSAWPVKVTTLRMAFQRIRKRGVSQIRKKAKLLRMSGFRIFFLLTFPQKTFFDFTIQVLRGCVHAGAGLNM
jgi:hypothetical protein